MADLPFLITAALISGTLFTETPSLSILTGIIAIGWIVFGWINPNPNRKHHLLKMLLCLAIATLAFSSIEEQNISKISVLVASFAAMIIGFVWLRLSKK